MLWSWETCSQFPYRGLLLVLRSDRAVGNHGTLSYHPPPPLFIDKETALPK